MKSPTTAVATVLAGSVSAVAGADPFDANLYRPVFQDGAQAHLQAKAWLGRDQARARSRRRKHPLLSGLGGWPDPNGTRQGLGAFAQVPDTGHFAPSARKGALGRGKGIV